MALLLAMRKRARKFIRRLLAKLKVGAVAICFCVPLPMQQGAYAPGVRSVSMRAFAWRDWLFEGEQ